MPVLISKNIAVSHERKRPTSRLQQRQSRLTVYLTTAKESDDDDVSIFNEACVQNALEEHASRSKKVQPADKLKLVWKRKYNAEKTPQDALSELLEHRSHTPRRKSLRLNTGGEGGMWSRLCDSRISVATSDHTKTSYIQLANDSLSVKSDERGRRLTQSIFRKQSQRLDIQKLGRWSDNEALTQSVTRRGEGDTSSTCMRPLECLRRNSRNVFNTRRATEHQEHHMFLYRLEKKRTPVVIERARTEDNRNSYDSLLDAMKAFALEREKLVPEMKNKVDVDTILRAYLSEQYLDLHLEGPEALELRRLYTATILQQPLVNNLIIKHPDMIPAHVFRDLVTFKKGFEVNPIYSPTVVKSSEGPWRQLCQQAFRTPAGSVLIELENDVPQYGNFYKVLLKKRAESVTADEAWVRERNRTFIQTNLFHLTVRLRVSRHNPGSTARFDLLRIFSAAAKNNCLLRQLTLTVEGWLDQLVKGLFATFKSIREETCQVLCLMIASYQLMKELYLSKYFDIIQDLSSAILRAIDQFEDTFPEYFILLAHIIHYCPSRSIIDTIMDRWSNFRCVDMIIRWPRLIYYAMRYWPEELVFIGNKVFGGRVIKTLDTALQRPLSSKSCRSALFYAQVRLNILSRFYTIYYDKESAQSRFLSALNV